MSWDGNSEIKVLNPVLREILKRYNDAGNFCDHISMCINGKCLGLPAAFCYENYDSNDIPHIPEKLDDVAYCIFDLIEKFEEDNPEWEEVKNQFRAELKECHDEIYGAYQYVLIETSEPGYWEGDEESRVKTFAYTKEGFLESLTPKQSKPKSNSKKKKANGTKKETLKDIFSQMDESASDIGIVAENGSLIKINSRKHEAYLGESDCAYIPEYITEMSSDNCNEFNRPGYAYEKFVITSNCKKISAIVMGAQFKWFYIIDSDTQEVIFKTDKFYDKNEEFGTDTLRDFEEHYFDDPEEAMACKDYKPVDDDYIANKESEMIREVEKQMIKSAETARRKVEEDKRLHEVVLAKHAEEWKKQYGKYVQNNPEVEFQGKVFVFTGLTGYEHDEDHPAVKAVVARGGKFHPRMIRNVDYLVADPPRAGETKSNGAVKNINEGRNTTIILLEDLQKILDGSAATTKIEKKAEAESAVKSKKEAKELPDKKTKTATEAEPAKKSKKEAKESPDKKTKIAAEAFKLSSERVHMAEDGWSIGVPEGFQYSVDPKKNGECGIIGKPYGLIVASGDEFNSMCYENPYDNLMSFVTLDGGDSGMNGAGLDLPLAELVLKNNIAYYKTDIFKWKTVKSTPTVRTMYAQFINDPVHNLVSYAALIINPQKWRRCQFVLGGDYKKADKEKLVKNMLQSVTYGKEDCAEDGPETVVKETKATKRKSTAKKKKDLTEIGFRKLSDTVSVNDKGASPCFIINNEWSFVLPEGCSYAVDSEFDGGAKQFKDAIDFSSSIKTMVMKDGGYFNFALEPHLNLMGEYYTVDACRNDDRFGDNSGASKKYVFADTDELYVDITAENTFFALILNIRVRGAAISPYTFDSMILPRCGAKQSDIDRIKELTFEIAKSIRLAKDVSDSHKKTDITATEKNTQSGDFFITDNGIKSCYCDKEEIIIPNGVTTIGSYAVSEKTLCKKIIIPNSVVEICDNAFSDNPALEEVVFGSSVKTIGAYAFHGCEKLLTIILPKGIETIGNGAFNNYKNSLETQSGEPVKVIIPDSVTFIGKGAFHEDVVVVGSRSTIGTYVRENNARHEYTDGEEIHIPTNFIVPTASSFEIKDDVLVKYLGEHDDIRLPASIKKIGKSAFKEKSPRSIWLENSVEEIEKEAFSNTSLEFVHISGTVKKIPEYAFGRCNSLATVQLEEGIQEIGSYAFSHIPAKEILLPYSLKTIGRGAFADSGITHLEIPDNVGEIGEYLCSDCSKLKSLTIGNNVTLIPNSSFSTCKKLSKITFGKNLEMIDARAFQETAVEELVFPEVLHNIGNSAFSECNKLRSVVFNDNLYRISSSAFYKCATLNSISLPASIKRIDIWAFRGTGITEVVIPYTAKNVDSWAFEDSVKKKRKSKPKGTTEEVAKEESEFVIEDGILKCYYGKKSKANIEIPHNITTIGKGAFAETKIASVIIPASVRTIEYKAFANCDELKTVEFGENVDVIGDYAFAETKITNLNLPQNLRSIGKNAFEGRFDSELKRINFGKELYSIGEYAFTKNAQLKEISFPDSLDEIGANAFSYCYGLTNISFGSNLKTIGTGAFSNCKALTNIAFKNSLKNIGFGAFQCCENLEDILLPDSVELIGDYAFNNCKGREYFEFPASVKKIGSGVLGNWESLRRLKIPASVQEIENNNAWAKITLIVEKGSYAEEYARQKGCKYETYEAVGRSAVTSVSSNISAVADDTRETHRREREESLRRHAEAAEAARKAEEERKQAEAAEAARKAEEERKQAEAAEAVRRAEEARKQAEAAEAARKAEEERKQAEAAEAARKAEEERKQAEAAEAARKAEEERKQAEAAEAVRKAEEERKQAEAAEAARKAEEARKQAESVEVARKAEEECQRAEAAEAARKAEEARKQVEATKAIQQELLRKEEEDELVAEAYQLELEKRRLRMDGEFTYNTKVKNRREEVWEQEETFRINAVRTQQVTEEIDPAAEQRRRLLKERKRQMRIVEENSGLFALFGEKARKRKAAEARIEQINKELARLRRR